MRLNAGILLTLLSIADADHDSGDYKAVGMAM